MSRQTQHAAMVDYFSSLLAEPQQKETPAEENFSLVKERAVSRTDLETLLKSVPEAKVVVKPVQTKVLPQVKVAVQTETENKVINQVKTAENIAVQTKAAELKNVQTAQAEQEIQAVSEPVWHNISTEKEFSALFFEAAGITLAVPMSDLGGIFQPVRIVPLAGWAKWFSGLIRLRGKTAAVVDTAEWLFDGRSQPQHEYQYVIMLGESNWGIQCDLLEGTQLIKKDEVKWRLCAGSRPWLAGIIKDRLCALLNVEEMIKLFNNNCDIYDLMKSKHLL